jgi:inorganic pyrophosphatase
MKDLIALPAFVDEEAFNVVIESPRASTLKFKYDPELGVMRLSRPLPLGLRYPHDWGFVPSTRAADGDPVDAIVVWDGPSYPGVVISCRPIGILQVEQTNTETRKRERNDRLAVLPVEAPRWETVRSIFDLSERVRLELEQFFVAAVAFEGKELSLLGWKGPADAMKLVRASAARKRKKRG